MKVSRTLLSLLLILILSFSILAACASEPAGTSSTPADISGTESAAEGFPLEEKNFGGKEITILCVDRHTYGVMQFAPDSEDKCQCRQRCGGPNVITSSKKNTD